MGACLKPTADMAPWYNVEVSGGHAEITATSYLHGWYRIREAGGEPDRREAANYTEAERAAAWITYGPAEFAAPAAPVAALLASLTQIAEHPEYRRWQKVGWTTPEPAIPNEVRAELGEDGRVLLTGPFIRSPEDQDGDHLHSVEVLYGDIAALLEAVGALVAAAGRVAT